MYTQTVAKNVFWLYNLGSTQQLGQNITKTSLLFYSSSKIIILKRNFKIINKYINWSHFMSVIIQDI